MINYSPFIDKTILNNLLYPNIPQRINENVVSLNDLLDSMHDNIHLLEPSNVYSSSYQSTSGQNFTKIEFKKAGTTSMAFKVKIGNHKFALKVIAYRKDEKNNTPITKIERPENVELKMSSVLSSFVLNKMTPHINLSLGYVMCDIKDFVCVPDIELNEKHKYSIFLENFEKNIFERKVLVTISEWANACDLHEFIKNNNEDMTSQQWRVILFQVIFTLHIIHTQFPKFRHNDLKINNVLMNYHAKNKHSNKKAKYSASPKLNFEIPVKDLCLSAKIMDFDFSCIEEHVENTKVNAEWTNKINVSSEENKYYDVFFFLKTLTLYVDKSKIPDDVRKFIYDIIPPDISMNEENCSEKGRLLINEEIDNCYNILKHEYFNSLKIIV